MWPRCDPTTFHVNHHPPTSSSPSTRRLWTAIETTTKRPLVGQTLNNLSAFAPRYDLTWLHHPHRPTTSPPMMILWILTTPLTSIANGSLQNKIFPLQKEIFNMLKDAFENWHRKNSMPSVPSSDIPHLWDDCWPQHCNQLHNHVNYPS